MKKLVFLLLVVMMVVSATSASAYDNYERVTALGEMGSETFSDDVVTITTSWFEWSYSVNNDHCAGGESWARAYLLELDWTIVISALQEDDGYDSGEMLVQNEENDYRIVAWSLASYGGYAHTVSGVSW